MSKSKKIPLVEDGIVVGTGSDKYQLKNPLAQYLLQQFDKNIAELAQQCNPNSILEIGCGEGHVTDILLDNTQAAIVATDLSQTIINEAKTHISSSRVSFTKKNIYDLSVDDAAQLTVCCEVLEHLEEPEAGLQKLTEMANPYAIISVPREPLWRMLNFFRGAHVARLGNSPGHIQHWSQQQFLRFLKPCFDLVELRAPIPWTIVLAKSKSNPG